MKDFKVNTESWHYKLNEALILSDKSPRNYPKDFCTYWRYTTYSLIISAFMAVVAVGILFVIGTILFAGATHTLTAAMVIGFITMFVGFCSFLYFVVKPYVVEPLWEMIPKYKIRMWFRKYFGKAAQPFKWVGSYLAIPLHWIGKVIAEVIYYFIDLYKDWRVKHPKKDPKPSITVMKYKAYKSKICPMVEYV